jgi:hypothetical protein
LLTIKFQSFLIGGDASVVSDVEVVADHTPAHTKGKQYNKCLYVPVGVGLIIPNEALAFSTAINRDSAASGYVLEP